MNQPDTYYDYEQDTEDEPYDDEVDYKVEKDPVSYDVLRDNSSEDLLTYRINSITFEFPRALSDAT